MHPVSPLHLASLLALALALTSCNGNDRLPAAADSPAAGSTPAITDASVGGPPPRPAGVSPTAPTPAPSATAQWRCGEQMVGVRTDAATQAVQLNVNGRTLLLTHADAPTGARYADIHGNAFWAHAGEATLTLAGGEAVKCTQADASGVG
ncbi:MliC family protein [Xanthomonas campestris]|uniref:MliC family protein n=1 Tax=Xanthomonas campestris TaxID=339 RepID=UPI000E1ECDD7|nr:MliC family protein [Xanthomonas campestris]MCW1982955.1 membrane-bound inhibitor of C-type lysozyme [Xanthomonas campestris]MCW2008309.1 membrane-bound inhibitor of C-type lysozyme [Xanthomonas campestris]